MRIDPYNISSSMQHMQPTLGEYLDGSVFFGGSYTVVPADFQRGLEWDIDTFLQLQETLFPWGHGQRSKEIWYKAGVDTLQGVNYRNTDLLDDMCYLQEISLQGQSQKTQQQYVQIIDGQQRTFCARSIALWALVEICRSSSDYEISSLAFSSLFIKNHSPHMTPALAMIFQNQDTAFEQLCSAFSISEKDRAKTNCRKQALVDYETTYTALSKIGKSVQFDLYSRICVAMDDMVDRLIATSYETNRITWLECILLRLLHGTNITLTVLRTNYDSATHFMHKNSTGKDLSESSQIKSLLMAHAKNDSEKDHVKSLFDQISSLINQCTKTSDVQVGLNHMANLIGHAINIDDHAEAVRLSKGKTLQRLNAKRLNNRGQFNVDDILKKIKYIYPYYLATYIKEANRLSTSKFKPELTEAIEFYRSSGPKAALYAILYAFIHHGEEEALRLTNALVVVAIRLKINEDYKKQIKQMRTKRASMNEVVNAVFVNIEKHIQKNQNPKSFKFVDAFMTEMLTMGVYSKDLEQDFVSSLAELDFNSSDPILQTLLRIWLKCNSGQFAQRPTTLNIEHILPKKPTKPVLIEAKVKTTLTEKSQEWVHLTSRIGNFALLNAKVNSSIKNQPFSQKKTEYAKKGHSAAVIELSKMPSFTGKDVDTRSKQIAADIDVILRQMWNPSFI